MCAIFFFFFGLGIDAASVLTVDFGKSAGDRVLFVVVERAVSVCPR